MAREICSVSPDAIRSVIEKLESGGRIDNGSIDEQRVLRLMREVKLVTAYVEGSASSRIAMRNEIRGLMMSKGLPSFFITINPADVYNPVLKFLAGSDIDVDNLLPAEVPNYFEQSLLVARNPVVAAKFFDLYMKTFIKTILGYESDDDVIAKEGGILGVVKAYYGCVEAQGRGSLHCHMLVWVDGALNPNEIRDHIMKNGEDKLTKDLVSMLEDVICNEIPDVPDIDLDVPSDSHHACAVRGLDPESEASGNARQKDLHNLAKQCQVHSHSHTCYKYWRGEPEPKECRFDLDEKNVRPVTVVDVETGEIRLRCLNGLVNNFNRTILEAMRCNMDIKFIGSGQSAKAVLYYITDYITKSQLKAHVAYAALELAAKRMEGLSHDSEDNDVQKAKILLQKCAYAIVNHQELSGQQVASYLLGLGDHYTSDEFQQLWWTSFERAVDSVLPVTDSTNRLDERSEPGSDGGSHGVTRMIVDSQEVALRNDDGEVICRSGQVSDYICRDKKLGSLSVWDFIASCRKVRLPTPVVSAETIARGVSNTPSDLSRRRARAHCRTFEFEAPHEEAVTHGIRMVGRDCLCCPVPIGPSIPRRDRPELQERYSRLMLILFKPWKDPRELKADEEDWISAFRRFQVDCAPRVSRIMENMQLLHECKDSRDDHFTNRRNRFKDRDDNVATMWHRNTDVTDEDHELVEGDQASDLAEHLHSIMSARSVIQDRINDLAKDCAYRLEDAGLMDYTVRESSVYDGFSVDVDSLEEDLPMESHWKSAYETIRVERQTNMTKTAETASFYSPATGDLMPRQGSGTEMFPYVRETGADLLGTASSAFNSLAPVVRLIEEVSLEYGLNPEQNVALHIICGRAVESNAAMEPLLLYIGGPGDTGKSRVMQAATTFFTRRSESRRLRLAAYTGVAASNIRGVTLHSALKLGLFNGGRFGAKQRRELVAAWEGVDFLVVDEISMIGCDMLYRIHRALVAAKGRDLPFGGVNMIFAGDFAQLPPVGQTRLYTSVAYMSKRRNSKPEDQFNLLGKVLWLNVNRVVMLHRPMRQSSADAKEFVALLNRLRVAGCSKEDYALLGRRVIGEEGGLAVDAREWGGAMILVNDNASKDAINDRASERFIEVRGGDSGIYHAADFHDGQVLADSRVRNELDLWDTGKTEYRANKLILCEGMPVILSANYDVEHGAVNGTFGTVKSVRYRQGPDGRRYATSCVIRTETYRGKCLPFTDLGDVPVLPDSVDIKFVQQYSRKKMTIKRKQLPLLPAFAMTVHKAQGLTLDKVVVDLSGCKGTESPYVMLSRVRKLDDVAILRPFSIDKITGGLSKDLEQELTRLQGLHDETVSWLTGTASSTTSVYSITYGPKSIAQITDSDAEKLLTAYEGSVARHVAVGGEGGV